MSESTPWNLRPRIDVDKLSELYIRVEGGDGSLEERLVARRLAVFGSPMPCPLCAAALSVYDAAVDPEHRVDDVSNLAGYQCPRCETPLFRAETGRGVGERLVWFWLPRAPLDPDAVKRLRAQASQASPEEILDAARLAHPCRTCRGSGRLPVAGFDGDDLLRKTGEAGCPDCDGTGVEPAALAEMLETVRRTR